MGGRSLRLCLVGEDNSEPMGEPSQWSFVHWLGGLDCFGSRNLNRFGLKGQEAEHSVR
jgi:hypothetical protein